MWKDYMAKGWLDLTKAQKKEGGKGGYLLVDRKANKLVSISTWNTEADLKKSEKGHRERISTVDKALLAQLTTELYEIVAQV
jgi:hypothetical protein